MKLLLFGLTLLTSLSSFSAEDRSKFDKAITVLYGTITEFNSIDGVVYPGDDDKGRRMLISGSVALEIWDAAVENGIEPHSWSHGKVTLRYKGWHCKQLDYGTDIVYDLARTFHFEIDGNIACDKKLF